MNKRCMRVVSSILVASVLNLSLWVPGAQAGIIGSEQVISSQASQQDRERIRAMFDRADVRAQLEARGVDADTAKARVDALTDSEVASITGQMDNLPAGGDIIGTLVFIFLVLLVTDILGFTKVFPFTKPIKR